MTATYPVVTDEAFPGEGVMRCAECGRDLPVGYPYATVAEAMVEDIPMSAVTCVYCGPSHATAHLRGHDPVQAFAFAFADADALREHLDALNEAGNDPVAVGVDSTPRPFLITLVGAYADGEDVLFDGPWQYDIDWRQPPRPRRTAAHRMEHLRFPVTVLGAP